MLVLYVPLAFAGMYYFDAVGIFAAYTVANIVSGVVAYAWARRAAREQCAKQAALASG